jgi:hypothetical protein
MPDTTFAVTWDYRCPFARNAHEHITAALRDGAPWDVTFLPFSLSQVHVPEGGTPVWEDPDRAPDLLALQAGIVVRDRHPEQFLDVHDALFAARHDAALDIRRDDVVRKVLDDAGVPSASVFAEIDAGWPLTELRTAHEGAVKQHDVFGVPTFILGDRAIFVRLENRPDGDAGVARSTIDRVLSLIVDAPELNEFKATTITH